MVRQADGKQNSPVTFVEEFNHTSLFQESFIVGKVFARPKSERFFLRSNLLLKDGRR